MFVNEDYKKPKLLHIFCSSCGKELERSIASGENIVKHYPRYGTEKAEYYPKYSQFSGKKYLCYKYACPSKRIFDQHDVAYLGLFFEDSPEE